MNYSDSTALEVAKNEIEHLKQQLSEANAKIAELEGNHTELKAIHGVVMCVGCVKEAPESDTYTLRAVKHMAMRINSLVEQAIEAETKIAELQARLEGEAYVTHPSADKKDAERYRQLAYMESERVAPNILAEYIAKPELLDRVIEIKDATMQAEKGGEG